MRTLCLILAAIAVTIPFANSADSVENRLAALEAAVLELQSRLGAKDGEIATLHARLAQYEAEEHEEHEEHKEHEEHEELEAHEEQESRISISGVLNTTLGGSDERGSVVEALQAGAHDPRKRGFNLQQFELAAAGEFAGFDLQTYVVFREDDVELEEAFAIRDIGDLELKMGYFLTEFGRINEGHLETWDFIDQPVINSRLFGGEGSRGSGLRLSWNGLSLTAQNSDGQAPSFRGEPGGHGHGAEAEADEGLPAEFGEEGIGGQPFYDSEAHSLKDLMYTARWARESAIGEFGVSAMWGRNGNAKDSETWIYGLDYRLDADDGRWSWQTELMKREYDSAAFAHFDAGVLADPNDDIDINLPAARLEDWGLYSQFIYNLNDEWALGMRYEYASGSGDSAEEGALFDRNLDSARGDRTRISPLLSYRPSERARLRLQYNIDDADFLPGGRAHGIWLGFELNFGDHPEHRH